MKQDPPVRASLHQAEGWHIRPASRQDREQLIRFHHDLYQREREANVPQELMPLLSYQHPDQVLRDDVDSILQRPNSMAWIAEAQEAAVGYITGHIEEDSRRTLSKKGVVEDWYVEANWRGHGIGRALFTTLLNNFKEHGCHVAESSTWPGNNKAREAHLRAGFAEIEIKFRKAL